MQLCNPNKKAATAVLGVVALFAIFAVLARQKIELPTGVSVVHRVLRGLEQPVAEQTPVTKSSASAMLDSLDESSTSNTTAAMEWVNATRPEPTQFRPCLCVFDVDRTLTGKQSLVGATCPANRVVWGVTDTAYGGGTLTLSELGQNVQKTFCGGCYLGVTSHGDATGDAEHGVVLGLLRGVAPPPNVWSNNCQVRSPLVLGCGEGVKQVAVRSIVEWYKSNMAVDIAASDVYMFDDRRDNIEPFRGTGFNAHQISCATRDGHVGLCGASVAEVQRKSGVTTCHH